MQVLAQRLLTGVEPHASLQELSLMRRIFFVIPDVPHARRIVHDRHHPEAEVGGIGWTSPVLGA